MPDSNTGSEASITIRIRQGRRGVYPVEARLSDGSFYEGALRLPDSRLQRLLAAEDEPLQYGQQLSEALFSGPLYTAYAIATGLARELAAGCLRVRLSIDGDVDARLQSLKWECLCEPRGTRLPLATSELTPYSHYSALALPEPAPLDVPRINMLFVVAAPTDLAAYHLGPIDVEAEVMRWYEALKDVWLNPRCHVTILAGGPGLSAPLRAELDHAGCTIAPGAPTLLTISEQLAGQHALHFLGHGKFEAGHGALFLERADGTADPVSDQVLAPVLGRPDLRLVFLAACASGSHVQAQPASQAIPDASSGAPPAANAAAPGSVGAARPLVGLAPLLVEAGVPAVVAMQGQLEIDASLTLTGQFYRRLLLEHGAVDLALNEARKLLYPRADWSTPVLFMRLASGQLAARNPLWTALEAVHEHPDYEVMRKQQYIPLPVEAIHLHGPRDMNLLQETEAELAGRVELMEGVLGHLNSVRPSGLAPFVLILGRPGSSKAIQLQRLGWETLCHSMEPANPQPILPVFLDVGRYELATAEASDVLEQEILEKLKVFWPDLAARTLRDLPPYVRLRVLISGGDVLSDDGQDLLRQALSLAGREPGHEYVLTASPGAADWDALAQADKVCAGVLAIQPLTQRSLRRFLEDWPGGPALWNRLYDSYLFNLASMPHFAVKMLNLSARGRMPGSRTGFLQHLLDGAIAQVPPTEGMRATAPASLRRLALEMHRQRAVTWPISDILAVMESVRGGRGYEPEALYSALVKGGVLLPVGEAEVRFAYGPLQAYCSAQALLGMPDGGDVLDEITASLGSPVQLRRWEETLIMASGLLASGRYADAGARLRRLLAPLVYGADLLAGESLFLAAHALLECRSQGKAGELPDLVDHVVHALRWRADSANEPYLPYRLRATQLLAQLGMPAIAADLAAKTYGKVRRNVADEWDYEFSNIRYAAAIALKRMGDQEAERYLAQLNPDLAGLFTAWQAEAAGRLAESLATIMRYSQASADAGLQGLAALALGDLHGRLRREDAGAAQCVLDRLVDMFFDKDVPQSVRWPVVDALSLLDVATVHRAVVCKALAGLAGDGLPNPGKIRKALAYLIGLLRLHDAEVHDFLVADCLGLADGQPRHADWSTWGTAIVALGRLGETADVKQGGETADVRRLHETADVRLLAEIALGKRQGVDLAALFAGSRDEERNYLRREAVLALGELGDAETFRALQDTSLAADPALAPTYYRVMRTMYWRQAGQAQVLALN